MSKKINNYSHYTSQGADLSSAHSDYTEYHEANHQSFFNMHNAAGLFKLFIIGGIILVVIVVLSPLFKLFKSLVGAGNAAAGFLGNLFKMCETIGHCTPQNSYCAAVHFGVGAGTDPKPTPCPADKGRPTPTPKPGASVPGTCDGAGGGSYPKGSPCATNPQRDPKDKNPPPEPCGSKISTTCKLLLAGWLFASFIAAAFGGLAALWEKWRNKDPGKTGEADKALAEKNPDLARDLNDARSDAAKLDPGGEDIISQDDITNQQVDNLRNNTKLPPTLNPDGFGGGKPPPENRDLYRFSRPEGHRLLGEYNLKKPTDRVSKLTGTLCSKIFFGSMACLEEGSEPDDVHGVKDKNGWRAKDSNNPKGEYYYDLKAAVKENRMTQAYADNVQKAWQAKLEANTLEQINDRTWKNAKLVESYDKFNAKYDILKKQFDNGEIDAAAFDEIEKEQDALHKSIENAQAAADDKNGEADSNAGDPGAPAHDK